MIKRLLPIVILSAAALVTAPAIVVAPAPNVQWLDAGGTLKSSSMFKGQAVVLIIAPSPKSWAFRSQVGQLHTMFERFAAQKVIFVAAFTGEAGRIKSNIPFALATDGPRVGFDYQAENKFTIAIIGRDGNLDYRTDKVLPAQRIYDVIDNSFVQQESLRRP